ncbi:DUF732 domain-containing protein [Antrihabitans cavernicola]|uniref:DUF732 domain-containing protein n=1 Tax=Antrihabitans cavernicola TaxID=2495913 RepID=A0A5A7S969_9NOCA|nr:DUF732 domain-containing protein [Spelaeibacter cavernicola]KAA0021085.1 hypothetical protein FOY51_20925 [Spelaeibacter cavernicola]
MRRVALLAAACVVVAGCGSTESPAASEVSSTPVVTGSAPQPPLDTRAQQYRDALFAAGIPRSQSDSTTLLLAEGICRQLTAGTPEPAILDNLRPLADYTATQSHGSLTGDRVAHLYLDTAKAGYCTSS